MSIILTVVLFKGPSKLVKNTILHTVLRPFFVLRHLSIDTYHIYSNPR